MAGNQDDLGAATKALAQAVSALTKAVGQGLTEASQEVGTQLASSLREASRELAEASAEVGRTHGSRRRAQKVARTRASLLDAARKVFAEKGYEGASVGDIAVEAGFTKGAVYANFGGKEELLLAIVDELAVQEDAWFEQWSGADLGTALAGSGDDLTRTLLSLEVFTYGVRHPGARAAIAPTVLRSWERAAALVHRQRTGEDGPVEQEDRDLALAAISVHTYAAIFARLVGAEHGAEEAGARAVERLLGS